MGHMVKDHSDSERGNALPPLYGLLLISSKDYFICGRGYWKFNNSLLKDPSYCTQIKNILIKTKNEYGLPIQN